MALGRFLLSAVVLGRLAVGHPTSKVLLRRDGTDGDDIIIYDSAVTEPTRVPQVLLWVDSDGKPVETATEDVLLLPTSLALGHNLASAAKASVTAALSTQTLLFPTQAQASSTHGSETTAAAAPLPPPPAPESQKPPVPEPAEDSNASSQGSRTSLQASSTHGEPTAATVPDIPSPKESHHGTQSDQSGSNSAPPTSERYGISYAPYRADHQCKSKEEIECDLAHLAKQYSLVRIYGTDCNQVQNVYSGAKSLGMKLFVGIWDPDQVENEANIITSAINGDWDMIHTVSVGNELVNNGKATPEQVVSAVKSVRSTLREAGYKGPVVTVDTFVAAMAHPELCSASDYCAINAHAFFDKDVTASEAGQWLRKTVGGVKDALPSPKNIVVTETGWPMKGQRNGLAVPSLENQKAALSSIRQEFSSTPGDVILFSAFNDRWKENNAGTFNTEGFWGIIGASHCGQ
ncbi:hypothetical protein PLICBS_005720 [Purpureocillium lilacinum]|uniref:uncharacterized protein n=1 Tax=Purpureocillium lilacinum TaxID=33203 RepID=UPI0020840C0E|nr:hypothetical protein PLICBS_005720 [Purpureocillium lilacinum]